MPDSPFVGPTYVLDSIPASVQRTVNMDIVKVETGNERVTWTFKDAPGLVPFNILSFDYYTSWPYPLIADDAMHADRARPIAGQLWSQPLEEINADRAIPQGGTLSTQLRTYDAPAQEINADRATPQSGTLLTQLHTYDAPEQAMNADRATPLSGTLLTQLVTYSAPEQAINADRAVPQSGTLA